MTFKAKISETFFKRLYPLHINAGRDFFRMIALLHHNICYLKWWIDIKLRYLRDHLIFIHKTRLDYALKFFPLVKVHTRAHRRAINKETTITAHTPQEVRNSSRIHFQVFCELCSFAAAFEVPSSSSSSLFPSAVLGKMLRFVKGSRIYFHYSFVIPHDYHGFFFR